MDDTATALRWRFAAECPPDGQIRRNGGNGGNGGNGAKR
jgi:hypothetical protein